MKDMIFRNDSMLMCVIQNAFSTYPSLVFVTIFENADMSSDGVSVI